MKEAMAGTLESGDILVQISVDHFRLEADVVHFNLADIA